MFERAKHLLQLGRLKRMFSRTFGRSAASRPSRIVGLVPARNEEHVIAQCLRALSMHTEAIVFLDDASTDGTLGIVESLAGECRIERIIRKKKWRRDEPGDRNALLAAGRDIGGTHFIVIDADELITSNLVNSGAFKRAILALAPGERIALNWIQLWRSIDSYRFDQSVWTWNYKEVIFCDDRKSSYSSNFIHTPRVPRAMKGSVRTMEGYEAGLLHFQFVNWRNLLVKQAWYQCLERIEEPQKPVASINERYGPSKEERDLGLKPSDPAWFENYPFFDRTVFDRPDSWREEQILGWFSTYGREYFAGLDIWDLEWGVPGALDLDHHRGEAGSVP
jgi:glycosyltransferase involved in cell wall biosynthesis